MQAVDSVSRVGSLAFLRVICDALPSARERHAAAIAYRRPVHNADPDADPAGAVSLAPMRVP